MSVFNIAELRSFREVVLRKEVTPDTGQRRGKSGKALEEAKEVWVNSVGK